MYSDLKGKAVLITGASDGIGAAAARAFGQVGAHVGVHYHGNKDGAESVVAAVRSTGGAAVVLRANLITSGAADKLLESFVAEFGRIDILINNAGDMGGRRAFVEVTDDFYNKVLDLNVRSVVSMTRVVVARFRKQGGGGGIINTTSMAARSGGGPGAQLYGSSKAFVQNLTRGLAKEYAVDGIRINAVAPGIIATKFHVRNSNPEWLDAMRKSIPMGRLGTAEDCAGTFLFLASDAASGYITGQVVEVNGGQLMP